MRKTKKLLALLLVLAMCVGMLAGCTNSNDGDNSAEPSQGVDGTQNPENPSGGNDTLVVANDAFDGRFSPFFYTAVPDGDVVGMLFQYTLTFDREANPILNGIEGETHNYNGTDYFYQGIADTEVVENPDGSVDYNITMRDDIVYSDGTPADIDDVIFGIYVVSDPTYDGSTTFFALPVEGMAEYRSGMETLSSLLARLGEDNTDFTYVTEEQQTAFWTAINEGGVTFAQEIVDYCVAAGYADEGDVAAAASAWAFDGLAADATAKDFFLAIGEAYGWNFPQMEAESAGSALADLIDEDVYNYGSVGVSTGESAPTITGVKKTGDYSMTVTLTRVDAAAIYQMQLPLVPKNYYGDGNYDYDNGYFGFPKGDLSVVKSKTTAPIGSGPYTYNSFSNNVVSLDANPSFYLGEPKIKHLNFQVVLEADKVTAVDAATVDIASPSYNSDVAKEIAAINGSDDFDGSVITVKTTLYLGYGYIGINAKNVSVGGDRGSDASKNLRKAIATMLAVYRDEAIDSYYGEWANIINYPISDTNWAAPRVTDEGYHIAFSTDVNGDPIYTEGMTNDEKYAAALEAALGFFEAAGYTVENGQLTAAPAGASMEYELLIPGGGTGSHPNFMIVTNASAALKTIGFNLIVTDLSDGTVTIGNNIQAGTAELWTMAWGATPDPDMYQIYYSDVANGGANKGGSSMYYDIQDPELDQLILDARASLDQNYRKVLYREALEIIIDWATEVPIYQRTDMSIFSTERVNISSIPGDLSPYYGWASEIWNLEMN